MSHTATKSSPETNPVPEEVFDKAEVHFFGEEDSEAGSVIGKMLSLFFLYTVVVMALVAYWTFAVTRG